MENYVGFREFINQLQEAKELVEVTEKIMPEPDVGAICQATTEMDGPALMLNVEGYDVPLVVGVHSSMRRIALSLGMNKEASAKELFQEFSNCWDRYPVAPVEIKREDAPCKQRIYKDFEVDITKLPTVRWNTGDGGPYLSKAVVITRDIETGIVNFAINRLQLKGPREVNLWPGLYHGIGVAYRKAVASGKPLEVAIVIGNEPAVNLSAVSPLPEEWDEYAFAGALKGSPIAVTKAEASDLPVPAHAEIVLEGVVYPDLEDRDIEGPFTEYTGHSYGVHRAPLVHIHTMTTREKPIYEGLYSTRGSSETDVLSRIPISVSLFRQIKQIIPEVTGFYTASTLGTVSVASIKQSRGGQAKQLIHLLWGLSVGVRTKYLFVVDDDVDPFNMNEVLWAFSTRFRGLEDLVIAEKTFGPIIDPASNPKGIVTRLGFDITIPIAPDTLMESGPSVRGWPQAKDWRAVVEGLLSNTTVELPSSKPTVRGSKSCPRCGDHDQEVLTENQHWELYKCKKCCYLWRNLEQDQGMDHKLIDVDPNRITFHPPEKFGK